MKQTKKEILKKYDLFGDPERIWADDAEKAMQEYAEAWHFAKMAEVTDEDICNHFPIGAYASSEWQKKQILRRQGVEAMRNGEIKHKEG